MENGLIYDAKAHQSFEQEWRPHHNCNDLWVSQGIFHEALLPESVYSYRASVQRSQAGGKGFCSVDFSLGDLLHAKSFEYHCLIREEKGGKELLYLDGDSLLFQDALQVLYERDALALRLRDAAFGLDLRLDRATEPYWYGGDGPLKLRSGSKALFGCALPFMKSVGRLYFSDYSMRVQGSSAFERLWGRFPWQQAAMHWERFYLFFNSGDQMMISEFPYGKLGMAWCLPENKQAFALKDYTMTAVDFLEIDEWRFASGWRLETPEYRSIPCYLIPLISEQFRLPVSRPTLGIFDKEGNRLGYALAELLPGARNELKRVPLGIYGQHAGQGGVRAAVAAEPAME